MNYKKDYIKPKERGGEGREKQKTTGRENSLRFPLPVVINQLKTINLSLALRREDSTSL